MITSKNLIQTKLYIPRPRANLVPRPRLVGLLEEDERGKLTLVSAPPGFGKTTLLSNWARQGKRPVAWLTLDERDNDLARFLTYLIAAVETVYTGLGQMAWDMLRSQGRPAYEEILTALLNEIASVATDGGQVLVLILDDYQLITARQIHEVVSFLLDFMPPQMRLVIASRTDPELSLGRLRVSGQLTELRAADLRFNEAEITTFFQEVLGLDLPPGDITALQMRTEGWVAGLQVAALSMRGRDDVSSFIQAFSGSNRYILDYLVEEVLARQPENIQWFLTRTAILDRLSGPLCDAVLASGASGRSQAVLEQLEAANLFIIPLDDERRWYRYHPLFAEFLRDYLATTQPEVAPSLHRRAAAWLEENGQPSEAVGHALAAGEGRDAARLVEVATREMVTQGEWQTLQDWLEALPEEQVQDRPRLALAQAWAHLFTSPPTVTESWLRLAEKRLSRGTDHLEGDIGEQQSLALHGEIMAIRATMASAAGDTERAIQLGQLALAQLPEDDRFLRANVIMAMGYGYRYSGEVTAAKAHFEQVVVLGQESGNRYQILDGLCNLANQQLIQGHRREGIETARKALHMIESTRGRPQAMAVEVYLINGVLLYEQNDLETAGHFIDRSLRLSKQTGMRELQYAAHFWFSQVARGQGDHAGAAQHMESAGRVAEKMGNQRAIRHVAAGKARLFLHLGDFGPVKHWVSATEASRQERPPSLAPVNEYEDLTLAQTYLVLGRVGDAQALLNALQPFVEAAGRFDHVYRIVALRALALAAQAELARSLDLLAQLLPQTGAEGYVRLYVDLGRPMAALLQRAAAASVEPVEVRKLLEAFPIGSIPAPSAVAPDPRPLTKREQEVMGLIVAGHSNQQIADELVISLGTVKRHISNIYRKLGVRRRTQAVAKARELGELGS
ncbi:MAG: LuxR C-terminal-related transcriptional regulator [Chloroflexota bacterium]